MRKICFMIFSILLLNACDSEHVAPTFIFEAPFNPNMVDEVEVYIKEVADKNGLRVFEKGRDQMRALSKGKEAFFIAFYYDNDPILSISSVGVPDLIRLSLYDFGKITLPDLEALAIEIKYGLKERYRINLKAIDPR